MLGHLDEQRLLHKGLGTSGGGTESSKVRIYTYVLVKQNLYLCTSKAEVLNLPALLVHSINSDAAPAGRRHAGSVANNHAAD